MPRYKISGVNLEAMQYQIDALTEERDRLKQWQADQVEVIDEAKALITELNADKKALEAERDRLKEIVDGTGLAAAAIAAERDRLALANAELLTGLEFYRDGFRYHPKRSVTGISLSEWKPTERLLDDCGETARALLDKHKATSTEGE